MIPFIAHVALLFDMKTGYQGQGAHNPYPPTKLEKEYLKSNTPSSFPETTPTYSKSAPA